MNRDVFTCIVGGKAGEGVKKAGLAVSALMTDIGRQVFQLDDYPSLIKGGHNFSVISSAVGPISSQYDKAQLIVAFDARAYEMQKNNLTPDGLMVFNSDLVNNGRGVGLPMTSEVRKYPRPELRIGVTAIAVVAAAIGLEKPTFEALIAREYERDLENNLPFAQAIYDLAYPQIVGRFSLQHGQDKMPFLAGSECVALGAVAGGLDIYFAYPMTPTTSLLHYLAAHDQEFGITVVHPENEIAVATMAIGAASVGAKAMAGSSGGGFALMEEAFSLAGMAETPILFVLGSRCGPSTGVPTYTEQADLNFALHQGHGEFPRLVASPGNMEEAYYLTAEMLDLVWQYQIPGIFLSEKHLLECSNSVTLTPEKAAWAEGTLFSGTGYLRYRDTESGVSPLFFPPSTEMIKFNSYEHLESGVTSDKPEVIVQMHDKRQRKAEALLAAMQQRHTVNIYGNSGPLIFTYGSTTMSVREALRHSGMPARIVQPIYLEPFPIWELQQFAGQAALVVEYSAAGQFTRLLQEKVGIRAKSVIRKYDGRPFDPIDLATRLAEEK